jgi:Flp pilus assembly protein TadG
MAMTRKWFGGNKGSIMAWSALAMIPLMGMASISVDGARAYMVKSRLSQAVDAAALAGGKTLNTANYNADIVKYFNVNFPTNYLGSTLTGPTITIGEGNDTVTVQAAANVPTTFARLIGTDYVTVSAKATVRRSITGMELALVMDNTGSMRSNGKINAMKNAATAMVNSLYNNGTLETVENFWVSVVPYVTTVNIGASRTGWLDSYVPGNFSPTTWKGCVEARTAPNDMTDESPSVAPYRPFLWRSTYTTPAGCTRAAVPPDTCTFTSTGAGCATGAATNCDNDWPRETLNLTITRNGGTARVTSNVAHNLSTGMIVEITGATQGAYNGWRTVTVVNPTQFTFAVSGNPASPATGTPRANVLAVDDRNGSQNNGYGPNLGCPTPLTPLTPSRTTVLNAISAMDPWHRGGTFSNEGLAWGWRTLSPKYRGLWGGATPNNLPLNYRTELMDKVIVLLTDGVNEMYDNPPTGPQNSDYTSYGRLGEGRLGTTNMGQVTSQINSRMLQMCSRIKQEGIIIFTILVQENNTATQNLFRDCATSPGHFYNVPDNATLTAAFQAIGQQLSNLRLEE